jgi:hypothetical protein
MATFCQPNHHTIFRIPSTNTASGFPYPCYKHKVDMSNPLKTPFYSIKNIRGISARKRFMLSFLLLAAVGCTKDTLDTRLLQPGTKCVIYAGVFAPKDTQPALPVTVVDMYRTASTGLIYYDVKDANGVIWQLPDNDLQVMQ